MTMANKVNLDTFYLEAQTNNVGFFSALHGLEQFTPDGYAIKGIVVAIRHKNNNWHTLELSHTVDNRFWWNNTKVEGKIASANFYNRPVKIIIFAQFIVG
jgi:hypothetical protein